MRAPRSQLAAPVPRPLDIAHLTQVQGARISGKALALGGAVGLGVVVVAGHDGDGQAPTSGYHPLY